MQAGGRWPSKPALLVQVWHCGASDSNRVEVHVSSLRRKLEAHGPRILHTKPPAGTRRRSPRSSRACPPFAHHGGQRALITGGPISGGQANLHGGSHLDHPAARSDLVDDIARSWGAYEWGTAPLLEVGRQSHNCGPSRGGHINPL
ncbi:MAG TPA: helix-turn-helix domain-containing protein [Acidimicrobiales bacterium]|nr:helix-turn-helix domain-containing protein [Acidimicrobiales bacterium]